MIFISKGKKENIIGLIFTNRIGQNFIVLSEEYSIKTEYYYKIKFIETGAEKIVEKRNLRKGNVKDNFAKNIYGVACKGKSNSRHPLFNKITFKRWYAMIERCYNSNSIEYKSYGGKGVKVCKEWLCFDNYIKDIKNIKGFNEETYLLGKIQLDKDLKIKGNKLYSPDTCLFVETHINKSNQPSKKKLFIAISPEGNTYEFDNQNECARQFNLTARTIGKVLNKQLKTHKGWHFIYK